MTRLSCPHLRGEVELSEEREKHIREHHPDLLPEHRAKIAETLAAPDLVCRSTRSGKARLFSRWYTELKGGKHVVVVVATDPTQEARHWIITAYLARELAKGAIEWKRS